MKLSSKYSDNSPRIFFYEISLLFAKLLPKKNAKCDNKLILQRRRKLHSFKNIPSSESFTRTWYAGFGTFCMSGSESNLLLVSGMSQRQPTGVMLLLRCKPVILLSLVSLQSKWKYSKTLSSHRIYKKRL